MTLGPPPPGQWRSGDGTTPFTEDNTIRPKSKYEIVPAYPEAEVRWVEVGAAPWGTLLRVPHYVVRWDGWRVWETIRFRSMDEKLKRGDVLFDVGAEIGWQSAILAKIVGGENMVLFEPDATAWPAIRGLWRHNDLATPRAMFPGLVGAETNALWDSATDYHAWPGSSYVPVIPGHDDSSFFYRCYRTLADAKEIPLTTLDSFCEATGVFPDAISIDVEGAELQVLRGAKNILSEHAPKFVWTSVHPDQMDKYGDAPEILFEFMRHYRKTHLGNDHEEHYLFERA